MKILSGDIGGTKTILQVVNYVDREFQCMEERRFDSQGYKSFDEILTEFFNGIKVISGDVNVASIGVAGPVTKTANGTSSRVTNLPWSLDSEVLAQQFLIPEFFLINDFQAVGYGIECLGDEDFIVLQNGQSFPGTTRAIIGAGTGLGQGILAWDEIKKRYNVLPSEGGHGGFSPADQREVDLMQYLSTIFQHVSIERVVSGPGISNIFKFVCSKHKSGACEELITKCESQDITPDIVAAALAEKDKTAVESLDIFVAAYGSAAANLALTLGASGGVYLAGGIAPKIAARLQQGDFISAFNAKSKMGKWLEQVPVKLITNEKVALLGAANYALRVYSGEPC